MASGINKQNPTLEIAKSIGFVALIVFLASIVLSMLLSVGSKEALQVGAIIRDGLLLALLVSFPVYWLVVAPFWRRGGSGISGTVADTGDFGRLAITDPLTRIMNRRGITISLLEAMAYAERYDNPLSIALIVVDGFPGLNQRYGRTAGDAVLIETAAIIADAVRMPDKIGRYSNEEFLLILPATEREDGQSIAERIRLSVNNAQVTSDGKNVDFSVSISVVQYQKSEDLDQFLTRAGDIIKSR